MSLHSQIIGEGTPFIILHGLLGMSDNWRTLGRKFSELGYQMHLVDQRNHGRSLHSDEFNYSVMAEDLKDYCDEHGMDGFILMGHSMGGKTAMQFATTYPEMVRKLFVADIGPKAYPQHHQDIFKALLLVDFSKVSSRGDVEEVLSEYVPEAGVGQFLMKNLYWKEKGVLAFRANVKVLSDKNEEVGKPLDEEMTYDGPTLFLGGENSGYIEPMDELLIHKHFPNARIDWVSNAGHWLHSENPTEYFEKVVTFLNE
ncbi:alpha/beta fold hydrolase [Aureitalea sp. L0-47]|uniref:alpha/beta fold hydrolase n=1 Tax=Aureitalea sp. L0-47 TaxID=2816962 RepID=UPI002238D0D4|nr:alpha/beta fold hydrolase [Aureitalea sp. L0-47]MCW5521092.1 alpha/beta fold hydrolase [Aureitalea sp. L0-47]